MTDLPIACTLSAGGMTARLARYRRPGGDETVLGVDVESTPLTILSMAAGLGLAAVAATRLGTAPTILLGVGAITLVWAALDVREVVHQLDESHTGIAIVTILVAALHLAAAAAAGRLAKRPTAAATT